MRKKEPRRSTCPTLLWVFFIQKKKKKNRKKEPNLGTVWPWGWLMMRGLSKAAASSWEGSFNQSLAPMKWTDLAWMLSLYATSHMRGSLNLDPDIDTNSLMGGCSFNSIP